jgi:hypothetical protein
MFDRSDKRDRFARTGEAPEDRGAVATRTYDEDNTDTVRTDRPVRTDGTDRADRTGFTRETLADHRARQREEFGGVNWGSAFFGWLVAVGMAVLLTGLLAAAGAAIGLTENSADGETLSLAGAIALLVVAALAYYSGGYVAGRMSRFDGGRQGLGVWVFGLLVTIALAVVAVIAGSEYNVIEQANLPRLPVGDDTLTTGGLIATAAIVLGTLLAAMAGGKAGERYHRRVDRVVVDR